MDRQRRVLVVEDEWAIAEDYAECLHEAGYEVVGPAASVALALRLITNGKVDAALLDLRLHGEESIAVADALGEIGIPFAFLTGYSRAAIPARFSAYALLQKPVAHDVLLTALKELLSES